MMRFDPIPPWFPYVVYRSYYVMDSQWNLRKFNSEKN